MSDPNPDWYDWHAGYRPDSGSHLVRRLAVVQQAIAEVLDARPPGPIRIGSLCAGQGDDLLGVLEQHPRAGDVTALLIEADGRNVAAANQRIARLREAQGSEAPTITMVERDAGTTSALAEIVPCDVLLLCGMFGNITMHDIETTIDATPALLAPGAAVIWTRRSVPVDLTPPIRDRFAAAGFTEVDFVDPQDDKFTVGTQRFTGVSQPFVADRHLFDFVGYATMIERGA